MTEPASEVTVERAPVARRHRLLASVAIAWAVTVVCVALTSFLPIAIFATMILVFTPVLWLRPLWQLPRASGLALAAAPFLLFAVPVVLVTSASTMRQNLGTALIHRKGASEARKTGMYEYSRDQDFRYRARMAVYKEAMRISVGGGALAALLEILGLYCWTRRLPATRWSIVLLLAFFGPAVAAVMYLYALIFAI